MVFLYPRLSPWDFLFVRFFGGGLGNLLFPWARAISHGHKYRVPVIFPTWPQIKIGTYLRREKDKRHYSGIFRPTRDYMVGWERIARLIGVRRIKEEDFLNDPESYAGGKKDYVVAITGYDGFFAPILDDHELIKKKLLEIVRREHIPSEPANPYVAVHIRLGDFKVGNQTTPFEFFDSMLTQVRAALDDAEILVFSDGHPSEIDWLLTKHHAKLTSYGSSIADILAISRSRLLIASKNSTFCWWGSYLGRMPVIWPKDTSTHRIYHNPHEELYLDNQEHIPPELFNAVSESFKGYIGDRR
jgi:hypothetical protein